MRSMISTRADALLPEHAAHRRAFSSTEADERAGQLVLAMAALESSHPGRPLLRLADAG